MAIGGEYRFRYVRARHWERLATDWLEKGAKGPAPFIEIRQMVFEGTYDAYQWERVNQRKIS